MRRAVALLVLLALATGAAAQDAPGVELPVGPYVRAGRPVVVRVVGGADRVRAQTGPWALPAWAGGDEFVLAVTSAGGGSLSLEIERDGNVTRAELQVRALPEIASVAADFAGPPGLRGGDPPTVGLPGEGLPTIREGWLLFDSFQGPRDTVGSAASRALQDYLDGPFPGLPDWPGFEPLVHPPSADAFAACGKAAGETAHLATSVVNAALLLVVVELVLLALVARGAGATRAWLVAPPALFLAWALVGDVLPGALRTTALVFDDTSRALVVVQVEARRPGAIELELPEGATSATLLRFDAEDVSARDASIGGQRVVLDLEAGERRLVAYSLVSPSEGTGHQPAVLDKALARWLAGIGLEAVGDGAGADGLLPASDGAPVLVAATWRVEVR